MTETNIRISKIMKEFNIGLSSLVEFLAKKGVEVEPNPNSKISTEAYSLVKDAFGDDKKLKEVSKGVIPQRKKSSEPAVNIDEHYSDKQEEQEELPEEKEIMIKMSTIEKPKLKVIDKIDLTPKDKKEKKKEDEPKNIEKPKYQGQKPQEQQKQKDATKTVEKQEYQGKKEKTETQIPVKKVEEIKIEVERIQPPKIIEKIEIPDKQKSRNKHKRNKHKQQQQQQYTDHKPAEQKTEQGKNQHVNKNFGQKTEQGKNQHVNKNFGQKTEQGKNQHVNKNFGQKTEQGKNQHVHKVFGQKTEQGKKQYEQKPAEQQPRREEKKENFIPTKVEKLTGPVIIGEKVDLAQFEKPKTENKNHKKRKRERVHGNKVKIDVEVKRGNKPGDQAKKDRPKKIKKDYRPPVRREVDNDEVQRQVKETLARLTENKGKTKTSKHRRVKREAVSNRMHEEQEMQILEQTTLKVTEFVTASELANMMKVPVVKIIEACMNLGLMVSINQRLDAEALVLVAEEFGFKIEFVSVDLQDAIKTEEDTPEDLLPRPPIVTVMGHVDHGKTSLLDNIRNTNVIAGEAGGITQHIGAYKVKLANGRRITFLDTPGHEAFTAMRARGAKVTDVAIIIIAADDAVMPQTIEAINHATAAGVPMVFAINKIDKPGASSEKIKEQLANMNLLVEDWGGKYQCQEISAKKGINVDKLLEKVLLEADMLELKANPNKRANGSVIESSLDKGRGYVATVLVHGGTLKVGDSMLSGSTCGKIKAMFNERGQRVEEAVPSSPVIVLGLNGAPAAGEIFNVLEDERETREIATKREQLIRIQGIHSQPHVTLDEIGRRIAIGNFKELNIIIKADVDGSIEALSDSMMKLSTEEVLVNVIHKAVGAISESDVLLAVASNAVIIGFQVRPSPKARKLAENEKIEIRLYSVIYDAINEVKDAIEGMLAPEVKEEITAVVEVLNTFKVAKVGTVAGGIVREGKITRSSKVRLIRDGIVVYAGNLGSLKRFKDDVKEVNSGYDCGLNIEKFDDVKVGDFIEAYEKIEIKRKS
ncbi:MAG: translation initiation factor IF-2 [Prevotellaceae bacterium]|jgi:translation initiation factor IF-2|nr:translation initiation factor IF-2 [Prevotellaceae bacterium]